MNDERIDMVLEKINELAQKFQQALISVDRLTARNILGTVDHGDAVLLVEKLVAPALEHIGAEWEQGRLALSQVYMSGRICEELVDGLLPADRQERKNQLKMAIAVLEDYHVLGKRIVYSVLRSSGFNVLDYGHGQKAEDLCRRAEQDRIEILLLSVLMLPSALRVKDVKSRLNETSPHTRLVVGGAPFRFDHQLWREVGADAMGATASEAIKIVEQLSGDAR